MMAAGVESCLLHQENTAVQVSSRCFYNLSYPGDIHSCGLQWLLYALIDKLFYLFPAVLVLNVIKMIEKPKLVKKTGMIM